MQPAHPQPIALALSGGGVRAMVFHLGVLKYIAERRGMERVARVSSVSGGSLLVGLMMQEVKLLEGAGGALRWPTSPQFLDQVLPGLRAKLCGASLQWGAARQLLNPVNLRFWLSRANLLALALEKEWGVNARLADLPQVPEWQVNGTTAETGKRFEFGPTQMGDYTLGYAAPGNFPLASALAVSAAFPGGFGPLRFHAHLFQWQRWQKDGPPKEVVLEQRRLHLYDGGVYDNLGLEPLFDCGAGKPKREGEFIIVSDAGAPLEVGFSAWSLNPLRMKRVADIMSDQSRALRVRSFNHYIKQQGGPGAYLQINTSRRSAAVTDESVRYAATFPTTLRKLDGGEFDRIAEHGYAVAGQVDAMRQAFG